MKAATEPKPGRAKVAEPGKTLPKDGYLRVASLSKFLDVHKMTIWRWVRQGKFPKPYAFCDRYTAWKVEDIHRWCKENLKEVIEQNPPQRKKKAH